MANQEIHDSFTQNTIRKEAVDMKKFLSALLVLFVSFYVTGAYALNLGGKELVKNGTGARSITLLGSVYFATLSVPQELKGKGDKEILDADQPMSIELKVDSTLFSKDKLVKAFNDGFGKAASAGYPTDKLNALLDLFNGVTVKKGEILSFSYVPGNGLSVNHGSKVLGTIQGLPFKKALFAIWIGPKPVQDSLNDKLLGK
jgi:hypothetical protein